MLAPGKHYINSPLQLKLNLQDDAGNDYDPTTLTIRILDPCRVETAYVYGTDSEVTRVDSGNYTASITPDEDGGAGRWLFRWETTGGVIALEGDFLVQDSAFFDWPSWDYAP